MTHENPCVAVFGPGPTGRKCGECANLIAQHAVVCDRGTGTSRSEGEAGAGPRVGPADRSAGRSAQKITTLYLCSASPTIPQLRTVTGPACALFMDPAELIPSPLAGEGQGEGEQ